MPKAYKRMPICRRQRKTMIPRVSKKKLGIEFDSYQHFFFHTGDLIGMLRKNKVKKKNFLDMNAVHIRRKFESEPMCVIDRLVSINCANRTNY